MSVVNVPVTDNFEQWRVKTNTLGTNQGDLTLLSTTDKTSMVNAVNEVVTIGAANSVAMAIALG